MTSPSFSITSKKVALSHGDFLVLPWLNSRTPVYDTSMLPESLRHLPVPSKEGSFEIVSVEKKGKRGAVVAIARLDKPGVPAFCQIKTMISKALGHCDAFGIQRVSTVIDRSHPELCLAACDGALTAGYVFDKYLSKKNPPVSIQLHTGLPKKSFADTMAVAQCVNFARDTLNEPPVAIHPVTLAQAYFQTGKSYGLKMTVWDEKKLVRENCGGILAVGGGSASKPRLVMAQYSPAGAKTHLALVGKGVTFDSGGYSLKPSKSMTEMKFDMGGAAMMFGAICAVSALKLPVKVTAFLPLVHNAISEESYNVSDVVRTRSGQTVEVHNTDAEGRIILADALTLACEQKPDYLIDAATLTGAAVVALGEDVAAVYGDSKKFVANVLDASAAAGENMWHMPLVSAYDEQLSSIIADMKNIGGSWGGSITAALFLKRFVKNVTNWIHIDIAGPGCKIDPLYHLGKGAKGYGIATIVEFAKQLK
ncbi:MAG: leucyl aminopeptidase family protein [Deltaproteobacteria bacterium]|nr:leucyl aminopeptidase family protein [Deltaproteobacteria bacterium]